MKRLAVMSLALALFAAPAASSAPLADEGSPAIALPGGFATGYATPVIVATAGGELTFANFDVPQHDFVHDVEADGFGGPSKQPWCPKPPKGKKKKGHKHAHGANCPVFWSAQVGTGQTTTVQGLENLKSGTEYTFFCTLHHNMRGTLIAP